MQAENLKVLNDHQILICFSDGMKRLFDTLHVKNDPKISEAMKIRWEKMIESGSFSHVEISYGDLVWPGWVEILSNDLYELTIPFEYEGNIKEGNI